MCNTLFLIFVGSSDPFNDQAEDVGRGGHDNLIHIRIQQRNGRKTLTTVQGINPDYDLKKIVKACKKVKYLICFMGLLVELIIFGEH